MIHLDTNYLIALVTPDSPARPHLFQMMGSGEKMAASTIAWSEFLNGPVKDQHIRDVFAMIEGRLISFGEREAVGAAELFNRTGRKRHKQIDCFIAATALCAQVPLATKNTKDFQPFVPLGLRLA
jgi:predicted nucleic acid-binding protein